MVAFQNVLFFFFFKAVVKTKDIQLIIIQEYKKHAPIVESGIFAFPAQMIEAETENHSATVMAIIDR